MLTLGNMPPRDIYIFNLIIKNMIKKIKGGYKVVSESGRNMGLFKTLKAAKNRLRQIEYFKHMKK